MDRLAIRTETIEGSTTWRATVGPGEVVACSVIQGGQNFIRAPGGTARIIFTRAAWVVAQWPQGAALQAARAGVQPDLGVR
eukprot:10907214-Alexandrium_andersonii.AAC.1